VRAPDGAVSVTVGTSGVDRGLTDIQSQAEAAWAEENNQQQPH
jgi:hypothetical protein